MRRRSWRGCAIAPAATGCSSGPLWASRRRNSSSAGRPADSTLGPATGEIAYSGIELDERGRRLSVEGAELDLTATEFDLLTLLLRYRGTVVRADTIARDIWGYKSAGSRNYLQAHVSRLRNKLRRAGLPELIKTVRSVGYVIR